MTTFTALLIFAAFCTVGFAGSLIFGLCVSAKVGDEPEDQTLAKPEIIASRAVPLPDPLQSIYDLECAPEPQVRA